MKGGNEIIKCHLKKHEMYTLYPHKWLLILEPETSAVNGEILSGELVGVYDFQGRQVFRAIPPGFAPTPAAPFVRGWMQNATNRQELYHPATEEVEMKEFIAVTPDTFT